MEAIFAVGTASVAERILAGRAALVSFAYIGTSWIPTSAIAKLHASCSRLVLDSGAFTAWTKGEPIKLDAYIAFVREHEARFSWIAALDSIGNAAESVENWQRMRAELPLLRDRIVPVFHEGEPLEVLDRYVASAPLVGLGRTEGRRSVDKSFEFYDLCFNRHARHAFHAFGNGNPDTLEPYPFASFDCSTWERDSTYGGKHRWPWSAASKQTRMRAYVEALSTVQHRAGRRERDLFTYAAQRAAAETTTLEE